MNFVCWAINVFKEVSIDDSKDNGDDTSKIKAEVEAHEAVASLILLGFKAMKL